MSQLKKGAILSYGNILLTNIIGLVITPFMIKALGDSEYGLYTLIGSLVTYFSLMDFGLNNTIIRFVAKYRAEKDLRRNSECTFYKQNYLFVNSALYLTRINCIMRLTTKASKHLSLASVRRGNILVTVSRRAWLGRS